MMDKLRALWFKWQVWYGSRHSCGGKMVDQEPITGYLAMKCDNCGAVRKYY